LRRSRPLGDIGVSRVHTYI